MRQFLSVSLLTITVSMLGCGGGLKTEVVTPPPPPAAKSLLEAVASSGELGSGAASIREALEKLKTTDAAKAETLLKDLDELEKTNAPAKIKEKAKAMAEKL